MDVVIPVYNGAATVESALASIQEQTVRDIRMIVVNDGSTDASRTIIERMAQADGRILLLNRENGGIVDALNDGLARCTAEIVARQDADDLAVPDRFEKQLAWLRSRPGCNAVAGAIIHIDEHGRELGPKMTFDPPEIADPLRYPQKEPYLSHPFLMMRRAQQRSRSAAIGMSTTPRTPTCTGASRNLANSQTWTTCSVTTASTARA